MVTNKKTKIEMNIYCAAICKFATMLLIFQVCRILFFAFNTDLFPSTTWGNIPQLMLGGLVFDLSGLIYVNVLYLFMQIIPFPFTANNTYQKVSNWIFYITNSIAIAANIGDIFYYRFTLRRTSFFFFQEFKNEADKLSMFSQIISDYWYVTIIIAALIFILIKITNFIEIKPSKSSDYKYYLISTALALITITLMIGGVRGGFAHHIRPITISNASQYVVNIGEEPIVLNTPFSIIRTGEATAIQKYNYFNSQKELNDIINPIHEANNSEFQQKNVVLLIIESFGKEYIGAYNQDRNIPDYKGYTPFLDSLISVSTSFKRSLANGRRSIDAMSSIFASIPAIGNSFVLTPYSSNKIQSIFSILEEKGYSSSFFHGAPNGSMGFLAFANRLGIDRYCGRDEYDLWLPNNDDFDGIWGVWDDKFLTYYSHELNQMKEPFISSIFTLSSHHPFKVPKEYEGKFDKGELPIHQTIGYTDMALRNFFRRAEREPWFENTIFVLCADHANENFYKSYHSIMGGFEIPIIIYEPSNQKGEMLDKLASQIDIMPTLLYKMGYNKSFFSFGQNLLENQNENIAITSTGENHYLYYKDYELVFNKNEVLAIYNYKKSFTENIIDTCPERKVMELKMKAFMQQHNNRMIENKLTTEQ